MYPIEEAYSVKIKVSDKDTVNGRMLLNKTKKVVETLETVRNKHQDILYQEKVCFCRLLLSLKCTNREYNH